MNTREEQLQELIRSLRSRKLTLSFAESCTGGALSAFLTEQAGVSDIFLGSVVSYSNEAKVDLLGVRRDTLMQEGAVSESVARQMACGARRQLKSDWSVALTGIAGPSGGTATKPVGTVCIAIAGPSFEESRKVIFSGNRKAIQQETVDYSVRWLCEVLDKLK